MYGASPSCQVYRVVPISQAMGGRPADQLEAGQKLPRVGGQAFLVSSCFIFAAKKGTSSSWAWGRWIFARKVTRNIWRGWGRDGQSAGENSDGKEDAWEGMMAEKSLAHDDLGAAQQSGRRMQLLHRSLLLLP